MFSCSWQGGRYPRERAERVGLRKGPTLASPVSVREDWARWKRASARPFYRNMLLPTSDEVQCFSCKISRGTFLYSPIPQLGLIVFEKNQKIQGSFNPTPFLCFPPLMFAMPHFWNTEERRQFCTCVPISAMSDLFSSLTTRL